jgi:prepilin-type N-terminal cleavage/methylation domain-containing protein
MKTDNRAFTLIELLVVIAIIAILAAILFPVFAQARAAARKTVCMSNMKEIMLGTRMYMDDYDGHFPRIQASNGQPNGWTVISWWAVNFYQQVMDTYIEQARGTVDKQNLWWDPSDPSKNMPYMWGSFVNNGLMTCDSTSEVSITNPSGTIYSTLRAWD